MDEDEIEDQKGYGFFDWVSHGIVGYDDGLQTYFANLDGSWGVGTELHEIPTIAALQRRLAEMFQGAKLPFNGLGLQRLAQGIETNPEILTSSEAASNKR